eukprot:1491352-Amphidinium_carterae.1
MFWPRLFEDTQAVLGRWIFCSVQLRTQYVYGTVQKYEAHFCACAASQIVAVQANRLGQEANFHPSSFITVLCHLI